MKACNICFFVFLIILVNPQIVISESAPQPSIYGKITDANTGLPIPEATVIIWDLSTGEKNTFITNETGEYYASGSQIVRGDTYQIFAHRGNFTAMTVDYAPTIYKFKFSLIEDSKNVSMSLVPGASILLEGDIYTVQSSTFGLRFSIRVVGPELSSPPQLNINYLSEYGDASDARLLGISRELVIVPANISIKLIAETWFFSREYALIQMVLYEKWSWRPEYFILDKDGKPFNLSKGSKITLQISEHSLRHGVRMLNNKLAEVSKLLGEMQSVGFGVFEERRTLGAARLRVNEAQGYLERGNYTECWRILRDAFTRANLVSWNIGSMRSISMASAVYLPAVLAIFAVILAFFLFEEDKRKMFSSIAIYFLFLITFHRIYPGTSLIMNENMLLFLESAAISIAATLVVIFGVPRVWKERQVEGEVSLKSAISIIFSMGKRQIRRKKLRGFFTVLSIIILVLAFTSLTSFGTVFGIVSETLKVRSPSDGILVHRLLNRTTLLSSPLFLSDLDVLSQTFKIEKLAPRLENTPSLNPVAQLTNPIVNKALLIYGIEGIAPANESVFTHLNKLVSKGEYLSENDGNEILISANLASKLNVNVNQSVYLYISGVSGIVGNFTIKGIFDDDGYTGIIDLDGQPFGPLRLLPNGTLRVCNSTEVILMNWQKANELQKKVNELQKEGAPQFAVLHEVVFRLEKSTNLDEVIKTLIFSFDYNVFVSSNNVITYHYIGSYFEAKGAAELIIPLVMVGLNVGAVMLNAVYERRREVRVLSVLGLNPAHIASTFVAEAIIMGMVGGGLGYLFGLGFYRIMTLFGQGLMVREKLEWWWSAVGFAIALSASVLSAIRPAMLAVSMYTPSMVRKIRLSEEKMKARRVDIFKVYQAKELSMPLKFRVNEKPFFFGFFLGRLNELKTGAIERVETIEELPEIEKVGGELVNTIKFDYYFAVSGQNRGTKNELICIKSPKEDYYRIKLVSTPAILGMPEDAIDRTIDFVHDILMEWAKNKSRILGV